VRLTGFSRQELERIAGGPPRRRWEIPTAISAGFLLLTGMLFDAPTLTNSGLLLLPIILLTNAVDAVRTGVARVRANYYLARWRYPLLFWFYVSLITTTGVVVLLAGLRRLGSGESLPLPRLF
jgi:hypothetical protein